MGSCRTEVAVVTAWGYAVPSLSRWLPGRAGSTPSRSGKTDRNAPSIWSKEWFSSIKTTTCLIGSVSMAESSARTWGTATPGRGAPSMLDHSRRAANPLASPAVSRWGAVAYFTQKGGGSWTSKTSNTSRFFRADEQTPQRVPVRDAGEAWRPGRPRQQGTGREAGQERPLPVRVWQAVQDVLPQHR